MKNSITTIRSLEFSGTPKHIRALKLTQYLPIHTTEFIELLNYDDIVFVQAEGNYSRFWKVDGSAILSSKTLGSYSTKLNYHSFIRTHQSFVVNMKFVRRIRKSGGMYLCLDNFPEVPVSRSRRKTVLKRFCTA